MDDIEAIRQLKARYFRLLDTKDWDGFRALFTDDVRIDTTESGGGVESGADTFVAFVREALSSAITVHHGHTSEIELDSPTTASGIWAMQDLLIWDSGARMDGYGHYHETYVKTDDGAWKISSSRLTRLHMAFTDTGIGGPGDGSGDG